MKDTHSCYEYTWRSWTTPGRTRQHTMKMGNTAAGFGLGCKAG